MKKSGTSGSNRKPPGPKPGVLPTAPLPDVVLFVQSERSDLNRRSPVPRTGAITRLRYVLMSAARMGIEPISPPCRVCFLGEYPAPIDERAMLCRCVRVPFTQWTGRRSNPRLLGFNQVLDHLSYQSVFVLLDDSTKKARCRDDTGLCVIRKSTAECHNRNGCDGSIFACS